MWNKQIGAKAVVKFLLYFECSAEVMEERLLKRAETSGRTDDNPETIKIRLETFKNESLPVVEQFEKDKMIVKLNAEKDVDEVFQDLQAAMAEKKYEKVEKPDVILMAGGPRSGKGTQAEKLAEQYDY